MGTKEKQTKYFCLQEVVVVLENQSFIHLLPNDACIFMLDIPAVWLGCLALRRCTKGFKAS